MGDLYLINMAKYYRKGCSMCAPCWGKEQNHLDATSKGDGWR